MTSYVVWAISRDGQAENLGELIVQGSSGEGNTGPARRNSP